MFNTYRTAIVLLSFLLPVYDNFGLLKFLMNHKLLGENKMPTVRFLTAEVVSSRYLEQFGTFVVTKVQISTQQTIEFTSQYLFQTPSQLLRETHKIV